MDTICIGLGGNTAMNAQSVLRRTIATVLLGLTVQAAISWQVSAQTAGSRQQSFLLGTGSIEGTYHPVGVALSTLIKLKLLPSLNVDLTAVNTGGSYENVDLARQNEVQFAILSALSAHQAQQGIGRFSDFGADENLRAITALWHSADHMIVRKDSVQDGTINDFIQLRGQQMSMGRSGSGTLLGNRALLSPLGVNIDTDFNLVELGFEDSAEALINGEIAGMALSAGLPVGAVRQVFDALGDEAVVLEFSDEQLAYVDQGRRVWSRVVIPAETYP
ncbi:MAG: TAXI family TRAP transporter solute-binding subunit, partial [Geminicoccaceae bacterium]